MFSDNSWEMVSELGDDWRTWCQITLDCDFTGTSNALKPRLVPLKVVCSHKSYSKSGKVLSPQLVTVGS